MGDFRVVILPSKRWSDSVCGLFIEYVSDFNTFFFHNRIVLSLFPSCSSTYGLTYKTWINIQIAVCELSDRMRVVATRRSLYECGTMRLGRWWKITFCTLIHSEPISPIYTLTNSAFWSCCERLNNGALKRVIGWAKNDGTINFRDIQIKHHYMFHKVSIFDLKTRSLLSLFNAVLNFTEIAFIVIMFYCDFRFKISKEDQNIHKNYNQFYLYRP